MQTTPLPITVPDLDVKYPKKPPVPPYMPDMYFIMGIVGSRGSGKTTKLVQMLELYNKAKTFDVIRVYCPSWDDDKKYDLIDKMDCKVIVEREYTDALFRQTLHDIDGDIALYDDYLHKKALYRRWLQDKKDLQDFKGKELREIESWGFQKPKAPWRYGKPNTLLIFDDLAGTSFYRADSKGVQNAFFIRHRHRCCSVIFLTQTYANSIPRGIRANLSAVMLFSNRNKSMSSEICSEFSSYISVESFQTMWDAATEEPHDAFFVDFESPAASRYRRNFNEAFVLPKRGQIMPTPPETKELPTAK